MVNKKAKAGKQREVKEPKRKAPAEKPARDSKTKRKTEAGETEHPESKSKAEKNKPAHPGARGKAALGPGKAEGADEGEDLEEGGATEPSDFVVCCQAKNLPEAESIRTLFEENHIPAMIEGGGAKSGAASRRINVLVSDNKLEEALDLLAERDQTSLEEKKEPKEEFGEAAGEAEEEEEEEDEEEEEGEVEGEDEEGAAPFEDEDEGHFGDDDEDDDVYIENDEE